MHTIWRRESIRMRSDMRRKMRRHCSKMVSWGSLLWYLPLGNLKATVVPWIWSIKRWKWAHMNRFREIIRRSGTRLRRYTSLHCIWMRMQHMMSSVTRYCIVLRVRSWKLVRWRYLRIILWYHVSRNECKLWYRRGFSRRCLTCFIWAHLFES